MRQNIPKNAACPHFPPHKQHTNKLEFVGMYVVEFVCVKSIRQASARLWMGRRIEKNWKKVPKLTGKV
ncbi:MAG: hypothetical protein A3B13_01030 [Candidatus Liptonbacteria bacterium RIFCSPLOWO2_01_FULL_45_15]|uniref:Uncharacterized protein n=1 Tax=Candidatus Liptonbacteria bacterium RIFCSPLOWO2_01_FULL_45_15 TaxID=1798649 RepID=A0A1G2CIV1_9BACT|nr:MAG: hypothetical protein A3B13_01030 [Candidatus Liptonbacteria bacterium RIFCSPLOWO2_01_FULL_45_15]